MSFCIGEEVPAELKEGCLGAALAIWTTTPWTMPANAAVAVNEKLQYSLVEAEVHNCKLCECGFAVSFALDKLS